MKLTRRTFALAGAAAWAAGAMPRIAGAQELTVEAVLFDPDGPVLGNPEGDVTIAEFFDYQCPYCKRNHPVLTDVVREDGNIRLVLKDWPIFGAPSVRASQLALGFASLDQYEEASDALMRTDGRLTEKMIEETLGDASLDVAAADAAYRDNRDKWDGFLQRNSRQAALLGLGGTPAFIIGTTVYPGAMSHDQLAEAVKAARG